MHLKRFFPASTDVLNSSTLYDQEYYFLDTTDVCESEKMFHMFIGIHKRVPGRSISVMYGEKPVFYYFAFDYMYERFGLLYLREEVEDTGLSNKLISKTVDRSKPFLTGVCQKKKSTLG